MSAYVNIHGEPSGVSARDALRVILPEAVCTKGNLISSELLIVRRSARRGCAPLGTGANEEAAWRDAWSRMLADDVAREVQA